MRSHLVRYILGVAGTLALCATAQAEPLATATSFTGGGFADGRSIFLRMTSASLPGTHAEVGIILNSSRREGPVVGVLDCARFVPSTREPVAVGGTLYASAIIDDNKRLLIRAVDRGLGGGMDEVGFIWDAVAPDPGAPMCGAADVETTPLMGGFVSVRALLDPAESADSQPVTRERDR